MACARTDGSMTDHSKFPLQPQKTALRFFYREVLMLLGWSFAYPTLVN